MLASFSMPRSLWRTHHSHLDIKPRDSVRSLHPANFESRLMREIWQTEGNDWEANLCRIAWSTRSVWDVSCGFAWTASLSPKRAERRYLETVEASRPSHEAVFQVRYGPRRVNPFDWRPETMSADFSEPNQIIFLFMEESLSMMAHLIWHTCADIIQCSVLLWDYIADERKEEFHLVLSEIRNFACSIPIFNPVIMFHPLQIAWATVRFPGDDNIPVATCFADALCAKESNNVLNYASYNSMESRFTRVWGAQKAPRLAIWQTNCSTLKQSKIALIYLLHAYQWVVGFYWAVSEISYIAGLLLSIEYTSCLSVSNVLEVQFFGFFLSIPKW
jgi:hypothetical protein